MPSATSVLYIVLLSSLALMGGLVLRRRPSDPLHRRFAATALALIGWLSTLHLLFHAGPGTPLTLVGRANFACILVAATTSFLFVCGLAGEALKPAWSRAIAIETSLLALLTVATPLVDRLESAAGGSHATAVGPLFPAFALHTVGFPVLAGILAYGARGAVGRRVRSQLALVGFGILATAAVNIVTGIVLPYGYGIFALEEWGALCVAAFAGAVGYAMLTERLFDIRIVVRRTVLFAILFALLEKAYSALVEGLVRSTPGLGPTERHLLSVAAVAVIAATYGPLRKWLEPRLDRLLFGRRHRSSPRHVPLSAADRIGRAR